MANELHTFTGDEVIATELPELLNQNFTAIPSNMGVWEKNEAVEVGDIRLLSGRENTGYMLECVASGITGSTQPVIVEEDATAVANYSDSGVVGRMRVIFNSAEKDVDEVFATGVVYNRSSYPELWEYVQLRAGLLLDEEEWQAKFVETNGKFVPYYSRGDGSSTFRTPMLGGYLKGAEASGDLGEFLEAGLPNVTGYIQARKVGNESATQTYDTVFVDGKVFQASDTSGSYNISTITTTTKPLRQVNFSLARGNAIYGNSDTVTPETMVGIWVIKAIGVIIDQGSTDLQDVLNGVNTNSQRITDVESTYLPKKGGTMSGAITFSQGVVMKRTTNNGGIILYSGTSASDGATFGAYAINEGSTPGRFYAKATDGTNTYYFYCRPDGKMTWGGNEIRFVKETYNSGTSWYRVWSDGWIEQGGRVTPTASSGTITFLKAFSNTNFTITSQEGDGNGTTTSTDTGGYDMCVGLTNFTTTTVRYTCATNRYISWYACGY